MPIITQVEFESANRKKDKSISLRFTTSLEQTTEQFMEFDKLINSRGILYFSNRSDLTQIEINEIEDCEIELQGKTKSQRLRNVLYVLHKQEGAKENFTSYYSTKMEQIIEHYKDKLKS